MTTNLGSCNIGVMRPGNVLPGKHRVFVAAFPFTWCRGAEHLVARYAYWYCMSYATEWRVATGCFVVCGRRTTVDLHVASLLHGRSPRPVGGDFRRVSATKAFDWHLVCGASTTDAAVFSSTNSVDCVGPVTLGVKRKALALLQRRRTVAVQLPWIPVRERPCFRRKTRVFRNWYPLGLLGS